MSFIVSGNWELTMGLWKAVKTRPALDEAVESLKTQLRRRSADLHLTYGRHHTLNVGSPRTSRYSRPRSTTCAGSGKRAVLGRNDARSMTSSKRCNRNDEYGLGLSRRPNRHIGNNSFRRSRGREALESNHLHQSDEANFQA